MSDLKPSSIKVTNHHNRSLPTALLQFIIHPFSGIISNPGKSSPSGSPKLKPHTSASRTCNIAEREVHSIWIYGLIAKEPQGDSEALKHALSPSRRIYYIAGGSFCMPPSSGSYHAPQSISSVLHLRPIARLRSPFLVWCSYSRLSW